MKDFDEDFFGSPRLNFLLADFDFRLAWAVARKDASVSAQVNVVFLTEIVLVEESFAERRNSYKKASASCFLNWYLAQCSIPSIAFQLGRRPGITILNTRRPCVGGVESKKVTCCIGEPRFQFGGVHTKEG